MSAEGIDRWEAAYLRFETPEEETGKFEARLRKFGAPSWPKEAAIVELFCGRGSGLVALERLGFNSIEGVDLSPALVANYSGPATCHVADCRSVPFGDETKDIVVIQGGLHHLVELPGDLRRTLAEAHRVLKSDGRIFVVEPWLTPFLRLAHAATDRAVLRRAWPKLDALAVMIDGERQTYEQWLRQPALVKAVVGEYFVTVTDSAGFGKWRFEGRKRRRPAPS